MKFPHISLFLTSTIILTLFSTTALPISVQVNSTLSDTHASSKEDSLSQNVAIALSLLSERKYNDAVILAGQIATQFPDKAIGYVLLGTAHDSLGNLKESENFLLKAIAVEPSDVNAYARLGRLYYSRIVDIKKAKKYLKKTISLNPDDYISHKLLSFIYLDENDEATAIKHIGKGLTSKEDVDERLIIAQYYLNSGRHEQAIEKCKAILEETPDNVESRIFLGRAYIVTKNYEKAIEEIKTAVSNDPNNYDAYILLSQAYKFMDDKTNAIRSLESAIFKQPKNPFGYFSLGDYYASENSYKEALYQYREAEEMDSKNTLIKNKIALMHTYLDQYDEAIDTFDQIRNIDGVTPQNELFAVQCLIYQNKTQEAEKRCLEILKKYPKNPQTLFMLSKIHLNNNNEAMAEKYLKIIISSAPGGSIEHEAYLNLSTMYRTKKDTDKLRILLTNGLKRFPGSEQIRFRLGEAMLFKKDYDEAENLFKEGTTILPQVASNYYGLGLVYLSKADVSAAEASLKKALELNPKHYRASSAYTSTLWRQEKRDETFAFIKSGLEKDPGDSGLMLLLAKYYELDKNFDKAEEILIQTKTANADNILIINLLTEFYIRQENQDKAENTLRQAHIENPSNILIINLMSDFYMRQKNYDKAMESLKKIVALDKDMPKTYFKMAQIYKEQGDSENEIKFYQKSISIDENQPMILNNIAWHIATIKNDPKKALPLAEKANYLAPGNPFILDTIGWIYYLNDDFVQSQNNIEQAVQTASNIPVFKYHLGKVYIKIGRTKDGIKLLEESIELYGDTESEEKTDAIKTIESIKK